GFQGAPEPLGFDDQGREVLRFVAGTPAWGDGFDQLKPARQLTRAARLIREFHEAVTSFVPPAAAKWQVLVPPDRCEIIAHHDLAPWNLIIGAQWAFIDWDTAAPGSRLWDLAWAVLGFVPLSADPRLQFPDATARMRAFVDAYGLDDEAERRRLAALLGPRARSMATFIADQAAKRIDPWLTLSRGGHGDAWRNTADYVDARIDRWLAALIS
ncbi:MAG: phosphotransferase, partial [Actinobacteria bacterium]|nr:phosphotransferase [Actinomycetota bacterium]